MRAKRLGKTSKGAHESDRAIMIGLSRVSIFRLLLYVDCRIHAAKLSLWYRHGMPVPSVPESQDKSHAAFFAMTEATLADTRTRTGMRVRMNAGDQNRTSATRMAARQLAKSLG